MGVLRFLRLEDVHQQYNHIVFNLSIYQSTYLLNHSEWARKVCHNPAGCIYETLNRKEKKKEKKRAGPRIAAPFC